MARLSIEECWWTDPRRSKLVKILGSEEIADGAALKTWRVAQEFWKYGRGLVPLHVFNHLEHAKAMIDCGLATVRESFVYVRGSSVWLDWCAERSEQAREAGKKSAEARRKKNGTAQPAGGKGSSSPEKSERDPNDIRTDSNASEPSVSGSGSYSSSFSGSNSENKKEAVFAFDRIFERYPNKVNKLEGLKRLNSQIKTEAEFQSFETAVLNYCRFLNLEKNKNWLKARQWDAFVGRLEDPVKPWEEWVNPDPSVFEDVAPEADWGNEAEIIFRAAKSHGFSLNDKVRQILGPERVELVRKAGGLSELGKEPDNQFTIKALAGRLKAAKELLDIEKNASHQAEPERGAEL